jgi:hypothetical protein
MNCLQFEACLLDLVGERSHEDLVRTEALNHASVCSRCAARLADERALAAGLRMLASTARHESAPARAEEVLLTRLRELGRDRAAVPASVQETRFAKPAGWKVLGYVGLAASILLLLGWALIQPTRKAGVDDGQGRPAPRLLPAPKAATSSDEKAAAAPKKVPSLGGVAAEADAVGPRLDTPHPEGLTALPPPERGIPLKKTPQPYSEPVRKPARPAKTRLPQVSTPEARVQYAARPAGRSERGLREAESAANDRVETEFLPFMAAGPQFPSEQRQFVRVKLPRSALQVFGLPMNMERAREPVQADVLLGEDGRALAVRFVKE